MARAVPRIHFVPDARATRWPDIHALAESDIERMPSALLQGGVEPVREARLRAASR